MTKEQIFKEFESNGYRIREESDRIYFLQGVYCGFVIDTDNLVVWSAGIGLSKRNIQLIGELLEILS